ncbi:type 4b pilus protein PilO2 [Rugamonas sp. CCM 8940]|uniref:type 4b pilus protein PilO2 n=1 Tax=Rugamonas sp. CCM 8940 TaxID=2765359 RepID=UPI0018F4AE05|nr:type 4b pilus protein PilO2 [Rugamonas sp. CCM 8940]MBJ7311955.1 type 4b pilus protein PilO2 [Rugamonas sp. CCM 8940]
MTVYLTSIGKQRFVCGLFWQSLSRPRELEQEARALARKMAFDLMLLRSEHGAAQAGFAQSGAAARRGLPSLAAAVCKAVASEGAFYDGRQQRVHNWLGAFKLPDGMWAYFAVRDANFLPNGDFAGSKEEVLERLHGDYGLGGWNVVIGDAELAEYDFHNFNPRQLLDLLPLGKGGQPRRRREWALRAVERRLDWRHAAAAGAVLLLLGAAGYAWWQQQLRQRAAAEKARAAEAELALHGGARAPRHPWAGRALPQPLAQACVERLTLPTAGGWQLDDYICEASQFSYTWSRQGSTIDYMLASVPAAVIDLSGEKAVYSAALAPPAGPDETLLEQRALLEPLLSRLQLVGLAPKLSRVPAAPPPPPVEGQAAPLAPDWKAFTFTLAAAGLPPLEVAAMLSQPGVRIDKLIYRAGAWSIEGVMYAK